MRSGGAVGARGEESLDCILSTAGEALTAGVEVVEYYETVRWRDRDGGLWVEKPEERNDLTTIPVTVLVIKRGASHQPCNSTKQAEGLAEGEE